MIGREKDSIKVRCVRVDGRGGGCGWGMMMCDDVAKLDFGGLVNLEITFMLYPKKIK